MSPFKHRNKGENHQHIGTLGTKPNDVLPEVFHAVSVFALKVDYGIYRPVEKCFSSQQLNSDYNGKCHYTDRCFHPLRIATTFHSFDFHDISIFMF